MLLIQSLLKSIYTFYMFDPRLSNTHRVLIAQEDDARRVAGRRAALVPVLVHDADGAVLRHPRPGLDVSEVRTLPINYATGTQRTHCREERQVINSDCVQEVDLVVDIGIGSFM